MNPNMIYAAIAAIDAWVDAGLPRIAPDAEADWNTGAVLGTGIGGIDTIAEKLAPKTDAGKVSRLGSTMVEQIMSSGNSARVAGLLGLGNQVTTNSSACNTGTEAVVEAFFRIREGRAERMLAGGSEGQLEVHLGRLRCDEGAQPQQERRARRGLAPALRERGRLRARLGRRRPDARESRERPRARRPHLGRNPGRLPQLWRAPPGRQHDRAEPRQRPAQHPRRGGHGRHPAREIDLINGHLTATFADPHEVENWRAALEVPAAKLPLIQSTKSLIGHALGAAGGIECVASVLQIGKGFAHGSLNSEDLHPELAAFADRVVHQTRELADLSVVAKASFGFGDVNGCVIFRKFSQ